MKPSKSILHEKKNQNKTKNETSEFINVYKERICQKQRSLYFDLGAFGKIEMFSSKRR